MRRGGKMRNPDRSLRMMARMVALALGMVVCGCSEPFVGRERSEPTDQPVPAQTLIADAKAAAISPSQPAKALITLVAAEKPAPAKLKITLPMAIEMCVNNPSPSPSSHRTRTLE
jgi:hypothetical protein